MASMATAMRLQQLARRAASSPGCPAKCSPPVFRLSSVQARQFSGESSNKAWLDAELERRRKERLEGPQKKAETQAQAHAEAQAKFQQEFSKQASSTTASPLEPEVSEEEHAQVERRASEMELFAYPRNRSFPWVTASIIAASGGLTTAVALMWNFRVCQVQTLDELRPELDFFTEAISSCSLSFGDLFRGHLHRLWLPSMLRAGEQPSRLAIDAAVMACCGALLERLQGPGFLLLLAGSSTAMSNALGAKAHESMLGASGSNTSFASSSGGVVALGTFCALRYGRWAAIPGLPVPMFWLMAPLCVAVLSGMKAYSIQLQEYSAGLAVAAEASEDVDKQQADDVTGFRLGVALAASVAIEDNAYKKCQPPPEDIIEWREELEQLAEKELPAPPDGSVWADAAGVLVGAVLAILLR
eukprot:TRINITY_DN50706_c0_g1_i1.p1 TRINITY_DN50706_c0_g1~~TRINITY_DN50706_c0_g1_i1.p1  ORF type:complete len:434 (-),score=106.28 TRINITY_DN50706_c0_g1_i1:52-1296(-)